MVCFGPRRGQAQVCDPMGRCLAKPLIELCLIRCAPLFAILSGQPRRSLLFNFKMLAHATSRWLIVVT